MAFTTKTLSDLKQSLADRHEAGTLPTDSATLAYWVRLLNRAKDYCADRLKLTKGASVTTVSGTATLADDFLADVALVTEGGLTWELIAKEQSDMAGPLVYWITGNQDSRFTLNTATGQDQTFTHYYVYRPEDMSADADECVIPDSEAVVARAYGMLRMAEFDPAEDADKSLAECDRRLDEIIYQRNLNDGPQGMTIQANA